MLLSDVLFTLFNIRQLNLLCLKTEGDRCSEVGVGFVWHLNHIMF